MLTRLWRDPEVYSRFYMQALFLFFVPVLKDRGERALTRCLFPVMHKVTAMKYHLDTYATIEAKLTVKHTLEFNRNPNENAESFDLICHFEAFMFQLKSSLDVLVKLFRYVPAVEKVHSATYARKGASLINDLRSRAVGRRSKGENLVAEKMEALAAFAEAAKDDWLGDAIAVRGILNHDQGARDFTFSPEQRGNGYVAVPPRFRGKAVTPMMRDLLSKTLDFEQEFMVRTLNIAKPMFTMATPGVAELNAFGATGTEFVRWCWMHGDDPVRGLYWLPGTAAEPEPK